VPWVAKMIYESKLSVVAFMLNRCSV